MGRCPVRSIFPQALEVLKKKQHLLGYAIFFFFSPCNCVCTNVLRFMADKIMPLSEAVEGYDIFDKMKAQKVVFETN